MGFAGFVGEASHPGPPSLSRRRRARCDVRPLSSDDEPLVLGALRNVARRLMECEPVGATQIDQDSSGTVPPTVPATGALVEVGREPPLDQVGDTETHEDMLDALAVDLEVDNGARLEADSVGPEDRSEERSCTGHQGTGDSSSDVQDLQIMSANVGKGNSSSCPAVNVQNRFNALMEDGEVAHTAPNSEPIVAALDADDTDSLASRSSWLVWGP